MLNWSSFQGVNRLFVISFENDAFRTVHTRYFLPTIEMKDYNIMIGGGNLSDHPVKNDLRTYDDVWKIAIVQGNDYTTNCLLYCPHFKR